MRPVSSTTTGWLQRLPEGIDPVRQRTFEGGLLRRLLGAEAAAAIDWRRPRTVHRLAQV
ncbi:hypothetical protein [Streptomyces microflavus]|uniref:hypothetical protein n=1 Tax=Streptomyces microflavus TaxID=1919 RepID=UPI0036BB4E7A